MAAIFIYVVLVLVGDAAALLIAGAVEHYSASASITVFFVLFVLIFWIAWKAAVQITERYFGA